MDQIRHRLRRMVNVALQIDHVGPLMQHAFLKTFLHRGGNLAHVTVALAEIHVVADADDLGQERNHVRRLAHGFAVGDLRFLLVQVRQAQAQRIGRRREAEARARGVVAENGNRQPGVEHAERLAAPGAISERQLGDERSRARSSCVGLFPRQQEIFAVSVGFEFREFSELFLERVHFQILSGGGPPACR